MAEISPDDLQDFEDLKNNLDAYILQVFADHENSICLSALISSFSRNLVRLCESREISEFYFENLIESFVDERIKKFNNKT